MERRRRDTCHRILDGVVGRWDDRILHFPSHNIDLPWRFQEGSRRRRHRGHSWRGGASERITNRDGLPADIAEHCGGGHWICRQPAIRSRHSAAALVRSLPGTGASPCGNRGFQCRVGANSHAGQHFGHRSGIPYVPDQSRFRRAVGGEIQACIYPAGQEILL